MFSAEVQCAVQICLPSAFLSRFLPVGLFQHNFRTGCITSSSRDRGPPACPTPQRSAAQCSAVQGDRACGVSHRTLLAPPSPFKSNFHTQHNTEPHKPRQKLRISRPSSDYEADSPVFLHTCPEDSFFWSGVRRTIRLGEPETKMFFKNFQRFVSFFQIFSTIFSCFMEQSKKSDKQSLKKLKK